MEKKKLYLSQQDKKIAGVCGGIAEYFDVDSTIVRLIWVIAIFALGTGLLAYIICAFVIPNKPIEEKNKVKEAKVVQKKKK